MKNIKQRQQRKPRIKKPVKIIVEHEFIGTQTIYEALTPIIIDDIQRKIDKIGTIDSLSDTA